MARCPARLIVGGPHDGQWHEISDDTDYIRLLVPPKESFLDYDPRVPQAEMVTIDEAHYKRERLLTPNRTYEFFRHVDLSIDDAFDCLFRRYGQSAA
jgi:hypothetical protein